MICFLFSHDCYYEEDLLSVAQDLLRSVIRYKEGHGDQEINWSLNKMNVRLIFRQHAASIYGFVCSFVSFVSFVCLSKKIIV